MHRFRMWRSSSPVAGLTAIARGAIAAPERRLDPFTSSILDLTRWGAALLVVLFHVRGSLFPEWSVLPEAERTLWLALFYRITDCGHQAVLWFFVASGFLVGGNAVAEMRRGGFDLRRYLHDRAARLYAVLLPALLLGLVLDRARVSAYGMGGAGFETDASYSLWTVVANAVFLQTIAAPTLGSNLPLWSLSYEAWYYVLFPLLLAPFWARHGRMACLAVAAGMLGILLLRNVGVVTSFSVWLLGVAVRVSGYRLMRSQLAAWSLACGIAVAYPELVAEAGGAAARLLVGVSFANALLTSRRSGRSRPLPGLRLHREAAGASFSLYAVHQPAMYFVMAVAAGHARPAWHLDPSDAACFATFFALVGFLLLVGWCFSRLTENGTDGFRDAARCAPAWMRGPGSRAAFVSRRGPAGPAWRATS